MSNLYEFENGNGILLYAVRNRVLLRKKNGEMFGAPVLLTSDYRTGLQDCQIMNRIYYSYISTKQELLLKQIQNPETICRVPAVSYDVFVPKICTIAGKLLLVYLSQEETEEPSLVFLLPTEQKSEVFPIHVPLSSKPTISLLTQGNLLFFGIIQEEHTQFYYSDSDLHIKRLRSECECISPEEKKRWDQKQSDELTRYKTSQEEKIQQLKAKYESEIKEKEQEILQLKGTIRSAANQYQDLMQVATRYKEEAKKWHDRYIR